MKPRPHPQTQTLEKLKASELQPMANEYQAKFDNWADILHPSIAFSPRFIRMVKKAIATGEPLTRERINAVFKSVPWEE